MAWPCPGLCMSPARALPRCRPASRRARGPDASGAVLLPSPRRANPLARIGRHFRNAAGTGVPARRPALWRDQKKGRKNVGRTQHHPKTDVVVAIVGLIPVAVGAADVVSIVVPRAAAHDLPRPPDWLLSPSDQMITQKSAFLRRGKSPPHPLQSQSDQSHRDPSNGAQSYGTGADRNTTRKPRRPSL